MASHKKEKSKPYIQQIILKDEILPSKYKLFEETDKDGLTIVGKIIPYKEICENEEKLRGVGGRIGVIPWYCSNVVKNDKKELVNLFKLGISNLLYLTDFGGGLSIQHTPLEGLNKELKEEVPNLQQFICNSLHSKSTLIFSVEKFYKSGDKSHYSPLNILIFVKVNGKKLNKFPFKASSEIFGIFDKTEEEFHKLIDDKPSLCSNGLRDYHLLRNRAEKNPIFIKETNEYFNCKEPTDTISSDSLDTSAYDKYFIENAIFNNNNDKAYKKRKKYHIPLIIEKFKKEFKENFHKENGKNNKSKSKNNTKKKSISHYLLPINNNNNNNINNNNNDNNNNNNNNDDEKENNSKKKILVKASSSKNKKTKKKGKSKSYCHNMRCKNDSKKKINIIVRR